MFKWIGISCLGVFLCGCGVKKTNFIECAAKTIGRCITPREVQQRVVESEEEMEDDYFDVTGELTQRKHKEQTRRKQYDKSPDLDLDKGEGSLWISDLPVEGGGTIHGHFLKVDKEDEESES